MLLKREVPMHYYFPWLKLATDCYRELHFDTLRVSERKLVTATNGWIKFPHSFVDCISVWADGDDQETPIPILEIDRAGERLRIGWNSGWAHDGKYILEYLTDGNDCDAATRVHPYAQMTIEDYVVWKKSPNRDRNNSSEAMAYFDSHKILRSRLNDLTEEVLQMINERKTRISPRRMYDGITNN